MCCQLNLFLLSMGYGLVVGVLYAFETLINPLLPALTESQVSAIGIAALVSGLPGAVFGGWVMDVTGAYKVSRVGTLLTRPRADPSRHTRTNTRAPSERTSAVSY